MASETKHIDLIMRLVNNVTKPLAEIRDNMQSTARLNTRLGRTVSNVGRSISGIGEALLPASAAIVGAAVAGGNAFMDFEYQVTAAGTKAGATAEQLQRMKTVAADIGRDFPITASEAAQGMDQLAAAGFDAEQTMAAMPGIVTAAVASGEDLASTSNVISSALAIWNLKTGDVQANTRRVADVIQMTANQTKMDMEGFGLAMQYAGAPAASLGITIEELGTAMGIMANNGLEATTIGTSLRSMLSRLAAPPKQAADAIQALGLQVKDSSGNFVGLENVINQMRTAMSGMSDTQQIAYAKAIAGQEAYSGLLALIHTAPADYDKVAEAIQNSSGSSAEAYQKMSQTTKGAIQALMSSIESIAITFGDVLSPRIQSAANSIKQVTDWISKLSPEAKNIIADVAVGIVSFTAFTLVLGKIVTVGGNMINLYGKMGKALNAAKTSTQTTSVVMRTLNTALVGAKSGLISAGSAVSGFISSLTGGGAMGVLQGLAGAVFSPMGLAILGVAAAIYVLYTRWDQIAPVFINMWNRVKNAVLDAWQSIQPGISQLAASLRRLWDAFQNGSGSLGVITGMLKTIADVMGNQVVFAVEVVASVLSGVFVTSIGIVKSLIQEVIGVFNGLIEFITGVFTGDWRLAWQGIVDVFRSIFGGVKGVADSVLSGVRTAVNGIIDSINGISFDVPSWVPVIGGRSWHPNIPHVYTGDAFFAGGPALINDRYGGEIVNLPHGAQVIPHDQSLNQAYAMGQRNSSGGNSITINIAHADMSSDRSIRETTRKVAEELLFQLQTREINMNEGAI